MQNDVDIDVQHFLNQVLENIDDLQKRKSLQTDYEKMVELAAGVERKGRAMGWWLSFGLYKIAEKGLGHLMRTKIHNPKSRRYLLHIEGLIKQPDFVLHVCPLLKTDVSDPAEVSKLITPFLLTSAPSKALTVPKDPLYLALLAIFITRVGVASVCPDTGFLEDS